MKPIVKKIIEAGLVERNAVQLMEKWGQVDRGASDLVGKKDLRAATESTLTKFAEEVESLIERDREEVRETRLAVQVGEPFLATWMHASGSGMTLGTKVVLFTDNMGNFMFPLAEDSRIYPGAVFATTDGDRWTVLSKETLYIGEQPYTIQVQAESRAG